MKKLIFALCFISISLLGYSQTYISLASQTWTFLNATPATSTIYYGQGNLLIDPSFDFKGSTGEFVATTRLNNIEATPATNITGSSFTANFINTGALIYLITLQGNTSTIIPVVTNVSNRGTINSYNISGLGDWNYIYTVHAYGGASGITAPNPIYVNAVPCTTPAPTNFAVTNITAASALASWTSTVGTYNLLITSEYGTSYLQWITGNSYQLTGLMPSTKYYLDIGSVVVSIDGCAGRNSDPISFTTPACPTLTLPGNLSVTNITPIGASAIWNSVAGAASYDLSLSSVNGTVAISGVIGNSYSLTGLAPSIAYSLVVKANAGVSCVPSGNSTQFNFTTPCPTPPNNLLVTNVAFSTATASWTNVIGATSYNLSLTSASGTVTINGVTANNYSLTGLVPSTTYSMVATASGGSCISGNSTTVNFTTTCQLPTPTNLVTNVISQIAADVSWTGGGATVTLTSAYPTISQTVSTNIAHFTALEPSTTYTLTVKAVGGGCTSANSIAVNFTTPDMVSPLLNSNLEINPTAGSDPCTTYFYSFTWQNVIGAISYDIQYKPSQSSDPWQQYEQIISLVETVTHIPCSYALDWRIVANSAHHSVSSSNALSFSTPVCPKECSSSGGRIATSPKNTSQPESDNLPTLEEMTVYPNPATDRITVSVPCKAKQDTPVMLLDAFGKVLSTTNLKQGERKAEISTLGFSDGLYFVRVGTSSLINVMKVMLIHK